MRSHSRRCFYRIMKKIRWGCDRGRKERMHRAKLHEYEAANFACLIHDVSEIIDRGSGRIAHIKEAENFVIELITVDAAADSTERCVSVSRMSDLRRDEGVIDFQNECESVIVSAHGTGSGHQRRARCGR